MKHQASPSSHLPTPPLPSRSHLLVVVELRGAPVGTEALGRGRARRPGEVRVGVLQTERLLLVQVARLRGTVLQDGALVVGRRQQREVVLRARDRRRSVIGIVCWC